MSTIIFFWCSTWHFFCPNVGQTLLSTRMKVLLRTSNYDLPKQRFSSNNKTNEKCIRHTQCACHMANVNTSTVCMPRYTQQLKQMVKNDRIVYTKLAGTSVYILFNQFDGTQFWHKLISLVLNIFFINLHNFFIFTIN